MGGPLQPDIGLTGKSRWTQVVGELLEDDYLK